MLRINAQSRTDLKLSRVPRAMARIAFEHSPRLAVIRADAILALQYVSDWNRYRRHSGYRRVDGRDLAARVIMDSHRVEKGLSLARPRPWFGRPILERLVVNIDGLSLGSSDAAYATHASGMALGALVSYFEYFRKLDVPEPAWAQGIWEVVRQGSFEQQCSGGIKNPSDRPDIDVATLDEFLASRESVRNFTNQTVPDSMIEACVRIAASSPSVCNRQGTQVRVFPRGDRATAVLQHQNGNAGFGEFASAVLVITHDLIGMLSVGERNQAYVDGGLFAMSLIYAFHARGIGTCCLNWSVDHRTDRALRNEISLGENEVVIMMVAVGIPSSSAVVTKSPIYVNRIVESDRTID